MVGSTIGRAGRRRLGGASRATRSALSVLATVAAAAVFGAVPASADPGSVEELARVAAAEATTVEGAAAGAAEATPEASPADRAPARRTPPKPPRRGGINPCMTPDPGFGVYDGWSTAPSIGQMIAPHKGGVTKNGGFDLVVHFHGHEPIRKEFVKTAKGAVLVGIDLGIGSGAYQSAFAAPHVFPRLLESVEAEMSRRTGKKAHVRKLALSSWSAGYGAIEQILRQPIAKKVDSLILLDSLHAGYQDDQSKALKDEQLTPFVDFAKRAAAGKTFMYLSHSSIIPPGYASTTEVADYVVHKLRGKLKKTKRQDLLGLDLIDRFDKGDLHVRGYTGDDKPDHCAHIGLMADVMRVHLTPRWKTPRGKR
jgi:hypothetical protein